MITNNDIPTPLTAQELLDEYYSLKQSDAYEYSTSIVADIVAAHHVAVVTALALGLTPPDAPAHILPLDLD